MLKKMKKIEKNHTKPGTVLSETTKRGLYLLFWPAFFWRIFLEKKNLAQMAFKNKVGDDKMIRSCLRNSAKFSSVTLFLEGSALNSFLKKPSAVFGISYLMFWPAFIWQFFLQKAALRSNGYEMNLPRAWAEKIRLRARQLRKLQIWDNYKSLFTEKKKREQVIHPMRSRGLWWCS